MPVQYTDIATSMRRRTAPALTTQPHGGRRDRGPRALRWPCSGITSNDASRLEVGHAQYSALTTPEGTPVDDLLVYRLASDHFLLVVNAANTGKDRGWISAALESEEDAVAVDTSRRYALLALQGPRSREILQGLTAVELDGLRY